MTVGAKVKQLRIKKGLSLQGLADEIGVSKPHIFEIEADKVENLSVKTLQKICVFFELPVSYFLEENISFEFEVKFSNLQKIMLGLSLSDQEVVVMVAESLKKRNKI